MADTTLYPEADARILEVLPDFNDGAGAVLTAQCTIDGTYRAFLRFDLSGLPAGAVISLATLRVNCYSVTALVAGVTDVQARRVSDDSWNEVDPDGITWNNQPAHGDVEDTTVPAVGWVEWDITAFAQAELADDETVSICLRCVQEQYDGVARNSQYRSRQYDGGSTKPELYIEYTAEPIPVPVADGDLIRIPVIKRS